MDDYEGVTHAGLAVVAADTGRVLLTQRAMDETDDPSVQETWEFPGGSLDDGEEPYEGALREFTEETNFGLGESEVIDGWRGGDNPDTGHYQGFVVSNPVEWPIDTFVPNDEVQAVGWFDSDGVQELENAGMMRPELVATMDWTLIFGVSGNKEGQMPEILDEAAEYAAIVVNPIPVHGVVAPEDARSGDSRGFNAGSMTRRPLRLPFRDTATDSPGHGGAFVVGSVDRLMRADGLVQWEGLLMPVAQTEAIVEKMQFFGGRYGVSVDGDQGSIDGARTEAEDVLWFEQVRAAGLTAVDIPAFHEAYVAFGTHPDMPADDTLAASAYDAGNLIGGRVTFGRGPGWVTNPVETNRIHDYWTKKGEEGYAKIGWGTDGDWTRAKTLIGAKIAANSPDKMRFLNQIISQWHFDALGYWPGELGKPGNPPDTQENRERAARHAASAGTMSFSVEPMASDDPLHDEAFCSAGCGEPATHRVSSSAPEWFGLFCEAHSEINEDFDIDALTEQAAERGIEIAEDGSKWEAVLTSSINPQARPSLDYFQWQDDASALVIKDADQYGFRHTYGYAAEWGVCHIGYEGQCVEPPEDSNDFADFHLGTTRVEGGIIHTGVITYKVDHRNANRILTETPQQSHFDNVANAWAAVRLGMDDHGIWFSGVVLPGITEADIVLIEATGQVSGEWKFGALRALQAVNTPGYPVQQSSAAYDAQGNLLALVASAHGTSDCPPDLKERMAALRKIDAESRWDAAKTQWALIEGDS